MRFSPRRDLWLGLVLLFSVGLPAAFFLWKLEWLAVLTLLPAVLFSAWLWYGTSYTIGENELRVQCGPFRENIPLASISRVRPTRNLLSSAALSLDRLEIQYGRFKRKTYISPAMEEEFLHLLRERCQQAEIEKRA